MDRANALRRLPGVYGDALVLRDVGASDEQIAAELGLDVASVPALLTLGDQKLEALLRKGEAAAAP